MNKEGSRARNWLLTLNQQEGRDLPDAEEWLNRLFTETKATYVIGQLERGEESGRAHIQAYANWPDAIRFGRLKRFDNTVNLREVKIDNGVRQYCMKEETRVAGPWEFGKIPLLRNSKTDWALVKQAAKSGEFDKVPDSVYVRHYSTLQRIYKDNCRVTPSSSLRGIYIYGKSEVGKSTLARDLFPGELVYNKLHNKWFDGYQNESVIIWDDLGLTHPLYFSDYFKVWTDRHGVRGETKGGVIPLNHKYFIFTSQYSLEEMFTDPKTYEAMRRRCFVYEMVHYKEVDVRSIFDIPQMLSFLSASTKPNTELFIRRT
jgi:hypothetical protein